MARYMVCKCARMYTLVCIIIPWLLIGHAERCRGAEKLKYAQYWFNKGEELNNDSEEELSYYRVAIKMYPDYAQAYNRIGEVYKARGEYDAAMDAFTKACEISPSFSIAHNNLGEIYLREGKYDQARAEFIRALEYNHDFKRAQNNLGFVRGLTEKHHAPLLVKLPSPIFFKNAGYVLPQRGFTNNLYMRYFSKEIYLPFNEFEGVYRDVRIFRLGFIALYGITDVWSIGAHPTFITKECRIERTGLTYRPRVSGVGDTIIINKFHLFKKKGTSLALYFNLSLPTGETEKYPIYQEKEFAITLGSGRTDVMWGINYSSKKLNRFYFHLNLEYRLNEKEHNIDPGDELYYNIALCKTAPYNEDSFLGAGRAKNLIFSLELNGWHIGESEPFWPRYESGGDMVFLSPGIQLILSPYRRIECGVQIPITQQDEGWKYNNAFLFRITTYGF
ncbi:MAG: tetratricopeptide repeat protein [bacterium]